MVRINNSPKTLHLYLKRLDLYIQYIAYKIQITLTIQMELIFLSKYITEITINVSVSSNCFVLYFYTVCSFL